MANKFKHLRTLLEDERKRLLDEIKQLEINARPSDARREGSPFGKREEEATESLELEKRLALEKQISVHVAEIEHALRKFQEGSYGLCDVCGQAIPTDRLEALPHASLCLNCKAKSLKGRVSPG